jgi:hypothetical protein
MVSQTFPEPLPTGPETAAPSTITHEPSNALPSESFCGGACCGACDHNDLLVPHREREPLCQPVCKPECFWLTGSFLMAWAKPSPLVPLVTTGFAGVGGIGGDAVPGGLGQPSTAILYGQNSVNFNLIPGFQIGGGLWLDQCNKFSVEASGFYLPLVHTNFAIHSDPNGNPVLSRPVVNPNTGEEDIFVVALPGLVAGDINIANTLSMWGAELNGVYHIPVGRHFKFEALAGVRYLNLVETLNISEDLVPLVGAGGSGLTFLGNTVDPPNVISTQDFFRTTNQFFGLQLGGGMKWECERFFFDVYGKAAVGVNQQSVQINGISLLGDGSGTILATAPGGILAVPSNMGNHTRSVVTVVPQGGFTAGINVTCWLRILAGYSFLYMDNVVRPASHLDRTVSSGQVPTDANFGATAGPMRPTFTFHEDGFWVNMFNIGVELHF